MDSGISYKRILKIALPIVIGGLAQNVIMATDAFFMAGVSQVSLDAVGLAGLMYATFYILGFGFSIGVQIIIARRDGEKDYQSIGKIFDSTQVILFAVAALMYAVIQFIGPVLLKHLVSSDAVYNETIEYLKNRAWGIFFALGILAYRSFFLGVSNTNIISYSTAFMAVLNIFLNYAFIFGHFGFPEMGIKGAAIASSLSEAAAFVFTLVYTINGKFSQKYHIFKTIRLDIKDLRIISKISTPIMLQYFLSHGSWFLFFIIIEQKGELALAISVVIRVIYMFMMTPFWGLGAATNTLVSFSLGENRKDLLNPIIKRMLWISAILLIPFVLLNMIFGFEIVRLVAQTDALAMASVPTLHMITVALGFFVIANIFFSVVSGSGNTKVSLWIEITTLVIYLAMSYWLGIVLDAEVHWIWLTEVVYFVFLGLLSALYLKYSNWSETKF